MGEKLTPGPENEPIPGKSPSGSFSPLSLLKSSGVIVGARIGGAVFGILTQILLARFLGAEDIGLYFVATGLAAVLSIVCTLGYPMLVPRIAADAAKDKDNGRLSVFMSRARFDTAILCTVLISGLLLLAWGRPFIQVASHKALIFAALTLPAFAMLRLNGSHAIALKRFGLGFLPDLFIRPLLLLLLVLVMWQFWNQFSIEAILIGHVVIAGLLAFLQMLRLNYKGNPRASREKASREMSRDWRRRATPLVLAALFIGVFADLDIIIAQFFLNDAQTGIFSVGLKISLFVAFGIQAIHQLILRDMANALSAGDNAQVNNVVARANLLTLLGSAGATAIVVLFGRDLLGFFGPEFLAGYGALVVLMVAQVVRAVAGPATQILALTGHEKACLPVFLVCIILLFVGNYVFINWLGMLGAAITVLIIFTIWSFWTAAIVHTTLGLRTSFGYFGKNAA